MSNPLNTYPGWLEPSTASALEDLIEDTLEQRIEENSPLTGEDAGQIIEHVMEALYSSIDTTVELQENKRLYFAQVQ